MISIKLHGASASYSENVGVITASEDTEKGSDSSGERKYLAPYTEDTENIAASSSVEKGFKDSDAVEAAESQKSGTESRKLSDCSSESTDDIEDDIFKDILSEVDLHIPALSKSYHS